MNDNINILGKNWTVKTVKKDDDPFLKEGIGDGYCDETVHEIVVRDCVNEDYDPANKRDLNYHMNKNLRHEIIHAFLFESGLAENSCWAQNEEMVDWFAIQWPKINAAFKLLNI